MQPYMSTNSCRSMVRCTAGGCFPSSGLSESYKRLKRTTKWVSNHEFRGLEKLTKSKGELEETMLLNFCAGAKVKAILQHPEAATIVKHASDILQKCRETQGDTSFDVDISLLHGGVKSDGPSLDTNSADEEAVVPRELEDVLMHLGVAYRETGMTGMRAYKCCRLSGIQFATHKAS